MAKKKRKVVKEEIDDFSKKTVTRKSGKKVITSKFKLDGKNIRSKQVRDAKGNDMDLVFEDEDDYGSYEETDFSSLVDTNGMPRTITKKDTTKSGQDVTTLVEATELRMMMNGSMIGVTMLILLRQSQSVTIQIRSATVMLPSM